MVTTPSPGQPSVLCCHQGWEASSMAAGFFLPQTRPGSPGLLPEATEQGALASPGSLSEGMGIPRPQHWQTWPHPAHPFPLPTGPRGALQTAAGPSERLPSGSFCVPGRQCYPLLMLWACKPKKLATEAGRRASVFTLTGSQEVFSGRASQDAPTGSEGTCSGAWRRA